MSAMPKLGWSIYASPVTTMTSHESQPSASISARDMGRNGATPKRLAQYLRYEKSGLAASEDDAGAPAEAVVLVIGRGFYRGFPTKSKRPQIKQGIA